MNVRLFLSVIICYGENMRILFIALIMLSFSISSPSFAQSDIDSLLGDIEMDLPLTEEEVTEQKEDDIAKPYLHEADQFYQYCEAESRFKTHYDCECLAAHFLDNRIKRGAKVPRRNVLKDVQRECIDASQEAYVLYKKCKNNSLLLPTNVNAEVYCTCYGNEYAKYFEEKKVVVNSSNTIRIQSKSHAICSKKGYADQHYGTSAGK